MLERKEYHALITRAIFILVLKSARRTKGHRVSRHEAQGKGARIMDVGRTYYANFFESFHILQSIFWRSKLDKCIRKVIRHQYNY